MISYKISFKHHVKKINYRKITYTKLMRKLIATVLCLFLIGIATKNVNAIININNTTAKIIQPGNEWKYYSFRS